MSASLLVTKFHIPPARPRRVPRPRLFEQLNQGLYHRLILVSAPAGFGKTTLLADWLADLRMTISHAGWPSDGDTIESRVAWLSLDEADNDPARFLAYLAAALGAAEIPDTEQPPAGLPAEMVMTTLINQVGAVAGRVILVLDDYHLITDPTVHKVMEFLLEHQPPNLHLVLATRADPPLPLPRLRARGQLTELRQSDLCFTTQEATAFLNQVMGLDLSVADVAALETRTEGWIAGLQLAALSLQGQGPHPTSRSEFIQAFTGSHRFVLDYLVEEVLAQQSPDLQEFLLKTSILEQSSGPLCDTILENRETGSQSILERLEAANLFIVPLDAERRWYRYHRLFSDLLRKRLRQTYPDLIPDLHRRASAWHEQQGLMAAAIEHALAAHDFDRAASLVEDNVEATLMRSEIATFLHWVDRLPDEQVRLRPTLCFYHAWAMLMIGRPLEAVEQRLQAAVEAGDLMPGRLAALRAYTLLFQADTDRAAELCRQALTQLPKSDRFLRSIVAWILSLTGLDPQDGNQALKKVAAMSQEIGNPLIAVTALCHHARLQVRQGRLRQAWEVLERALQLATDSQGRRLPIASKALMGLGELELEWDHLEAAADHLIESIELSRQWSELAAFDAYFPLARVRLAQGDTGAAREALETARQIALKSEATELDDIVADLQLAYLAAVQGDLAAAERWAEKRGLIPNVSPGPDPGRGQGQDFVAARLRKYEQLVLARLFLLQNQATEALDLLEPLLALARQLGRVDLTVQIQILRALAFRAAGQRGQALDALAEALSLAEPGGCRRVFLDEGEPMAGLLRQAASQGVAPAYVAQLLAAFGSAESAEVGARPLCFSAQSLLEPLSQRELEVLRLLAAGLSNPEIAGELVVAVSTVRSHCKSIYGKLGVHKRWDAVQQAQELGLV